MPKSIPNPHDLLDMRIPDGSYEISAARHAKLMTHIHAPELFSTQEGGRAHPIFAHISTNRGMGWDFPELLAHVGASVDDGVVFGGGTFDFPGSLTVGERYTIRAQIFDVRRKQGRRIGPFDAITLALEVVDAGGRVVVRTTETYIVPRPSLGTASRPPTGGTSSAERQPSGSLRNTVGPITRDDILGIMAVMEDSNPVHVDSALAKAAGYRGAVHQGPANLAFVLNAIAVDRGGIDDIRHVEFTFRETVSEGDLLDVYLEGADPIAGRLQIRGVGTALICGVHLAQLR